MSSLIGKIVDRSYRLQEQLGQGGMGAVYRATSLLTGKPVALKLISQSPHQEQPSDSVEDRVLRLALAREFQTLASLHHPNVIRVLSYGFDEDLGSYFTMELLPSPKTFLDAAAGLSTDSKVLLIAQLLRALVYVHQRGILHRDIKPGNVLVVDGEVKLLDFGIASALASEAGLAGTLDYMAPELLLSQPPSIRSDLYSVGVMFYLLLSGIFPYSRHSLTRMLSDLLGADSDYTFSATVAQLLDSYRGAQNFRTPDAPIAEDSTEPIETEAEGLWPPTDDIPPALSDLLRKLLARRPEERPADASAVLKELAAAISTPIPVETTATRESFLQATQLIGREAELEQLLSALNQAKGGPCTGLLIGGESGSGKSRLLAELRTQALVHGFWVVEGQSTVEGTYLYQEWLPLLRSLCLRVEMNDEEAAVFKDLIPEIGQLIGRPIPDPPVVSPEGALLRLVRVLLALLGRQPKPLLLIFEDLHWGKPESLDLLIALSKASRELPLLLVGTYRSDEKPQLPQVLSTLKVLPLMRLTAQDVARLSESMLGPIGRQAHLVDYLIRQTEGNVFFLVEIVRALAENAGELARIGEGELPENVLTAGIGHIVEQRIAQVPTPYQELLDFSAVLGRQLDIAALSQRFATVPLPDFLIVCANAAVLESQGNVWRFAHDKLRETILRRHNQELRMNWHRQVAETLETVYQGKDREAQSATLAQHFQEAGILDKALQYRSQAGEVALRLYAHAQALVHFMGAESLLFRLPNTAESRRRHADILLQQLKCSVLSLPPSVNLERLTKVRELLQSLSQADAPTSTMDPVDRLREARADYYAARLYALLGEPRKAAQYYQRVYPVAREFQDPELIVVSSIRIGMLLTLQGQIKKAYDFLTSALQDAERVLGRDPEAIYAQVYLATILSMKGRFQSALPVSEQVRRWEEEFLQSAFTATFRLLRVLCFFNAGDWVSTIQMIRPAIELAEKRNERLPHYVGLDILAGSLSQLGQTEDAFAARAKALELRRQLGGGLAHDWFNAIEAEMLFTAGRIQEALVKAQEVANAARTSGMMLSLVIAERVWGLALARLGANLVDVEVHLQEGLTAAINTDQIMQSLWTELSWGRIYRERGDETGAALHFARARQKITDEMSPFARDEALHYIDAPIAH